MGVYIPNMAMPTSCDECRIMVFDDNNCIPELDCGCPIVFKSHPQGVGHRPDYCPLVSVDDVRPVVRGKWIWTVADDELLGEYWKCILCDEHSYIHYNFCPNCGADMREVDE